MSQHMLPFPLGHFEIKAQDIERVLDEAKVKGGSMNLETAMAHLLYHALVRQAGRGRRRVSSGFRLGAAIWSAMQLREALWRIEQECLVPLINEDGTEAIYEELEAFGRRAPEHFDDERQAFRF
ncbi:MAG: hypothetical protein ACK4MZ_04985 [Thermomonas haemolytica]